MSAPRLIVWSFTGTAGTAVITMASTVVLSRLLTPTEIGIFAYAGTIFALVQWLLQAGMGNYILRETDLTQEKINGAYAFACGQGLVATLIVAGLAPLAGLFSHRPEVAWVTLSVAVVPLLAAPETVGDALLVRNGRFPTVTMLMLGKATAQTAVALSAQLLFGWGVYALVAGVIANMLVSFLFSTAMLLFAYRARPRLDRHHWRLLRGFGGRSFMLTLAQILSLRLPDLFIGRLLGVTTLGHISRAVSATEVIGRTLSASIVRVLAPRMMRRVEEGQPLAHATADFCDQLLFFVWPALAGMAVLAQPIIRLLFGGQWEIAGRALPFLCLAFAIDSARAGGQETMLIRDRLGLNAWIEFLRAACVLILIAVAARYGLVPVLWARVAEATLTLGFYFVAMRRLGGLAIRRILRMFAVNGLLAAAAAAPAAAMMARAGWPRQLGPGGYFLAVGGGLGLWLATIALIRHPNLAIGYRTARALAGRGRTDPA